jgi:hypothetical protein
MCPLTVTDTDFSAKSCCVAGESLAQPRGHSVGMSSHCTAARSSAKPSSEMDVTTAMRSAGKLSDGMTVLQAQLACCCAVRRGYSLVYR